MSQTMLLLSAQEVSDIIENAVQRGVSRTLQARLPETPQGKGLRPYYLRSEVGKVI